MTIAVYPPLCSLAADPEEAGVEDVAEDDLVEVLVLDRVAALAGIEGEGEMKHDARGHCDFSVERAMTSSNEEAAHERATAGRGD